MSAHAPHNEACENDEHSRHLCFLMYDGFHLNHRTEYKELVQDPEYRCQYCGRTAHEAKRVCGPLEL